MKICSSYLKLMSKGYAHCTKCMHRKPHFDTPHCKKCIEIKENKK